MDAPLHQQTIPQVLRNTVEAARSMSRELPHTTSFVEALEVFTKREHRVYVGILCAVAALLLAISAS